MDPFTGNRYAFGAGNPTTFVELDGHLPCKEGISDVCGGGASTVGAWCLVCLQNYNPGMSKPRAHAPKVDNADLKDIIDDLYAREFVDDSAVKGDGRTVTALIHEYNTGKPVGKWHAEKASNKLAGLAGLLEKDRKAKLNGGNGLLSETDLRVARNEARDLWNALNSRDVTGAVTAQVQSNAATLRAVKKNRASIVKSVAMADLTGQAFEQHHPKAPPRPVGQPTNLRGGYKAFGIAGGVASVAQAPSYVEQYGYGGGAWEMFKDIVDPFGAHDALEPGPVPMA